MTTNLYKRQIWRFVVVLFVLFDGSAIAGSQPNNMAAKAGGRPLRLDSRNLLWERYLLAGENARNKGDLNTAKKYWLASLSTLEKDPSKWTSNFKVLGKRLIEAYPQDLEKKSMPLADKISVGKEEVNVYGRVLNLTRSYHDQNNVLIQIVKGRYDEAAAQLRELNSENSAKANSSVTTKTAP